MVPAELGAMGQRRGSWGLGEEGWDPELCCMEALS